ncbi:protein translocase subunit SecD [Cryptosporangium aurantiacum]|uniref:Protein translocase subunit SecD n=1 Tax=Cryptosporangium aurantiacum TaxID=134849 RepID=A0A1M7RFJ6_9ACTN|nr:protein translocase subunit SecD [Cryptosporangium aurantiacum]SHN45055.1 preprotein translocase subunit SecD [Cryptosporangium aurantiacum]
MAPPRGQLRAGRYLTSLAVLVIALYALVFFTGDGSLEDKLTPRLGLDLQGGTTVTLRAAQAGGKAPDAEQLEQARQIIENRVNGTGVAEAEVVTEGDSNIVINAPGENNDAIKQVGEPAQLRFRAVLESAQDIVAIKAAASATVSATPTPSTSGTASPSPSTSGTASPSPSTSAEVGASPTASGSGGGGGAPEAAPAAVPAAEDTPSPTTSASPSAAPSATPSGSASPSASATPSATPTSASQAALQKSALAKFPKDAATYVSQGTAEDFAGAATNPQLAAIFEPGAKKLTDAEVAALPLDWQFKVPWITCTMLDNRPAGSIDAVNQQVVACDGNTKYKLEKAGVVGTDIDTASFTFNQQQGGWVVNLKFTGKGQDKWTNLTKATLQKQVAVVLDNEVISAPTTNEVITGDTQISGQFSKADAQDLAAKLKFGALPLSFTVETAESISPTLGIEQLEAGLLAGGIGLGLVVVYSLLYYRALGLVTIASLVASGAIIYASVILLGRQIGFTLTLAGVAGFIVAVGITADSFVVFFERLKDEVRDGRSVRSAVPRAWVRARRTILSADAVSFLAAAVLYILAVGAVKGFAFTLGLSTLVDVIIVFLFTHPLVAVLSRSRRFTSPRFSGLGTLRKTPAAPGTGAAGRPAATARRVSPKES